MNRDILSSHLNGNPLPEYPTSHAIHIRHINQCWNWTKGELRDRIYTEYELNLMFTSIKAVRGKSGRRIIKYKTKLLRDQESHSNSIVTLSLFFC